MQDEQANNHERQVQVEPKDSQASAHKPGPEGLGGWLIVVGLGLVATLPMAAFEIWVTLPLLLDDPKGALNRLMMICGTECPGYIKPILMLNLATIIIGIGLHLWSIVLFFAKHLWFPKVFIGTSLLLMTVELLWLSVAWLTSAQGSGASIAGLALYDLAKLVVPTLIWVSYMLMSVRVANTFVRRW